MATRTQIATRPHVINYELQHNSAQSEVRTPYESEIKANLPNAFEVPNQKSSRRDRVQILLKMLQAAESPIRKTHLMYGAGINFYQLEKHLTFLIGSGMIEELEQDETVAYRTTEKGRLFSQLFT
jgi:predicted transcriptional regulator